MVSGSTAVDRRSCVKSVRLSVLLTETLTLIYIALLLNDSTVVTVGCFSEFCNKISITVNFSNFFSSKTTAVNTGGL